LSLSQGKIIESSGPIVLLISKSRILQLNDNNGNKIWKTTVSNQSAVGSFQAKIQNDGTLTVTDSQKLIVWVGLLI